MAKEKVQESDAQKFARLTNMRTNKALTALRTLGPLAKYTPSTTQRDKVFGAIQAEMKKAFDAWTTGKPPAASGFNL